MVVNANGPFMSNVCAVPLSVSVTLWPPFMPTIVPPMLYADVAHVTATSVTLSPPAMPTPLPIVHFWVGPDGCELTETAYGCPVKIGVANVNGAAVCGLGQLA